MVHRILYLIYESFRGIYQHRRVIFPASVTILLSSLLLCVAGLAVKLIVQFSKPGTEEYRIEAFLKESASENLVLDSLEKSLWNLEGVSRVDRITKENAKAIFIQKFGRDMFDLVDSNPLPASFALYPIKEYQNASHMASLERELKNMPEVEWVNSSQSALQTYEEYKVPILSAISAVVAITIVILWMIISNSIRLTLYSRRSVVENMKYLGASELYIQFPFIVEGLVQGLVGALGASLLTGYLWSLLVRWNLLTGVSQIQITPLLFWITLSVSLLAGLTSQRTVKKYLRAKP